MQGVHYYTHTRAIQHFLVFIKSFWCQDSTVLTTLPHTFLVRCQKWCPSIPSKWWYCTVALLSVVTVFIQFWTYNNVAQMPNRCIVLQTPPFVNWLLLLCCYSSFAVLYKTILTLSLTNMMTKFKYSWIVQSMDTRTISHTVKHEEGNTYSLYEKNYITWVLLLQPQSLYSIIQEPTGPSLNWSLDCCQWKCR